MHPDIDSLGNAKIVDKNTEVDVLAKFIPKQYDVLGKVSQGGMGAIYKVQNRYTGAYYALKVIRQNVDLESASPERFILEARLASSLNHPNICRVCDFGVSEDTPYLVMEWIDGISLERKINRDGPLAIPEALAVFQQVALALDHAHAHKVVHRDLKPDNVMLTRTSASRETQVHLVDFGLAKVLADSGEFADPDQGLTRSGIIMGSPLYMSPEQGRGLEIDPRTDIYSFGCLMYMALTGGPPFRGNTAVDTITMHLHQQPPPIDPKFQVPPALENIVLKCLEKDCGDRYQSMSQLRSALVMVSKGVRMPHVTLNVERRRQRSRFVNVVFFVGAFVAVYLVSLALQDFLDKQHSKVSDDKKPVTARTAMTGTKVKAHRTLQSETVGKPHF